MIRDAADEEERMADDPSAAAGAEGDAGTENTLTEETEEEAGGSSAAVTTKKVAQQSGLGKRDVGADRPVMTREGEAAGPRKTKVVIKDAAWSTWWAVLFYVSIGFFISRFQQYSYDNVMMLHDSLLYLTRRLVLQLIYSSTPIASILPLSLQHSPTLPLQHHHSQPIPVLIQ
jgi:hypothetical protein